MHLFRLINLLLLIITLQSCAVRSLYIPVSQNLPIFDSNKKLIATGYLGSNHVELQTAFNPSKHFAVGGNINFGSGIAIYDAMAGIYGGSHKWRYTVLTGFGYNSNITFPTTHINLFSHRKIGYEVNSLYLKYYLQPSLSYCNAIKIYKLLYSFSFSTRISMNHFKNFTYKETDARNPDLAHPVYIVNKEYHNKNLFLLEPCITNKVGIKNLYAIIQVQGIVPYSKQIDIRNTHFSQDILLSLGIEYNLRFKKHRR